MLIKLASHYYVTCIVNPVHGQTDKQTPSQTDRQTDRQTLRQTDKHQDRHGWLQCRENLDITGKSNDNDFSPTPIPASLAIFCASAPAAFKQKQNWIGKTHPSLVRTWTCVSCDRLWAGTSPTAAIIVRQLNPTTSPVTKRTPYDASLTFRAAISNVGSNQPSFSSPVFYKQQQEHWVKPALLLQSCVL